jgi:hypothetical protein
MYLADRRRSYVMQILIYSALGAVGIVFASYAFRLAAFSYVFTGGSARFWFSLNAVRGLLTSPTNAPVLIALAVSAVLYVGVRRCRYFGNTVPLLMALALFPIVTTQAVTRPWLWALPFLFTFLGGVFADVMESRYRKLFLALAGLILATQALLCLTVLPSIAGQL